MERIEFEVADRKDSVMLTAVYADIKEPVRNMTLYFDNRSGDILYPVRIESVVPVTIVLESDTKFSCSFPPAVSEEMISDIVSYFDTFNDVVAAARRLIEKEKQRIGKYKEGTERSLG